MNTAQRVVALLHDTSIRAINVAAGHATDSTLHRVEFEAPRIKYARFSRDGSRIEKLEGMYADASSIVYTRDRFGESAIAIPAPFAR